jgi:hypothetical protein
MNPNQLDQIPRNHVGLRRLVPLTEIRHFYHLLRDTLVSMDAHLQIAEEFLRVPNRLQELFERSRTHFCLYDNHCEGFHPRHPIGELSSDVLVSPAPVHQALRHIRLNGIRLPNHPELDANFVDYELSPIRTTKSTFENGVPCQAKGGVDILLANDGDKLPVVVEIKGATDKNLFFALIQALTYAVEFSTPLQRERMDRTYSERFACPNGPALDIYLLLVGTPKNSHHANFLRLVNEICEQLLAPGTAVANVVRRIVCLEKTEPNAKANEMAVRFLHPLQQPLNPPNE